MTDDFIPEYIDKEPSAFMGLSMSELMALVLKAFFVTFPLISTLLVVLTGHFATIVISFILSLGVSVLYTKFKAEKIREESKGKPVGFSDHKFKIALELFLLKYPNVFTNSKPFFTVVDGLWGR
jgi:conjugative transfer region protein (TIGR03750 family)